MPKKKGQIMMRFNAVISGISVTEEIPEKIKLDDNNTLVVKGATVILNEFDRSVDPLSLPTMDKGFTVGLKLTGERRHFEEKSDGRCAVEVNPDQIGNYEVLSPDASLKDVMNAINRLIHNIGKSVGEPTKA